jgi:hypothetical protein
MTWRSEEFVKVQLDADKRYVIGDDYISEGYQYDILLPDGHIIWNADLRDTMHKNSKGQIVHI